MKRCRAISSLKEPSFCEVWVGNTVLKAVDFLISIRETLAGILRQRNTRFSEQDFDLWFKRKSIPVRGFGMA